MKKTIKVTIANMYCSNCALTIQRYFNEQTNIDVNVIVAQNTAIFTFDDGHWNLKKIDEHLKKIGYRIKKENQQKIETIRLILACVFSFPLLLTMFCHLGIPQIIPKVFMNPYVQWGLATIVIAIAGINFYKGFWRDIKNKRLGMDVLITLGTSLAYLFSIYLIFKPENHELIINKNYHSLHLYFETAAVLLTIIHIGKFLEEKAKRKTADALQDLMKLSAKSAFIIKDNQEIELLIEEVKIDDILIVKQGEKIPLDGIIIDGIGSIDESMMSGESLPVSKSKNDKVVGGTLLLNGSIKVKVNATYENSYLSNIIRAVEKAQSEKPKIQKIADKVASFFVPGVILISIICFIVTILFIKKGDLVSSLERAIAVLVISCPCSLGLATPLSIMVGTSRAAKIGIIYKNAEIFEKIKKIDAICFDKTGTLSKGQFKVLATDKATNEYLSLVYSMESVSKHPIALSLLNYCKENGAQLITLKEVEEIVGLGIKAKYNNHQYLLTKPTHSDDFIKKNSAEGYSLISLYEDSKIMQTFAIFDEIKEEAVSIISKLHKKNIQVYMITGDSKTIANSMANKLGIKNDFIYSEVKPFDKENIIKTIQKSGKKVAFVGDGINDALALNSSDLAISMGSGSDAAISSSDITLSNNNLNNINRAINLSYKVLKNIKRNFIFAFSYNIVAIPLAFAGILSPLIAGICMAFSNISVVVNSLTLNKSNIED